MRNPRTGQANEVVEVGCGELLEFRILGTTAQHAWARICITPWGGNTGEAVSSGDGLSEYGTLVIEMRRIHRCHDSGCVLQCFSKVDQRIDATVVTHGRKDGQEPGLDLVRSVDMVKRGQQEIDVST